MLSRSLRAAKVLSAGCLVYFVMAACSASDGSGSGAGTGPTATPGTTAEAGPGATSPVPNAMAEEVYTSGSRLKVQWLEGADGSKQFFGWYDSGRKEQCTFGLAVDQAYRCLPRMATISAYFTDVGCSVPLVSAPTGSDVPKVAVQGNRYVAVGEVYRGTLWNGTPGTCAQSVGPAADFYRLGDAVDPGTFVKALVATAP